MFHNSFFELLFYHLKSLGRGPKFGSSVGLFGVSLVLFDFSCDFLGCIKLRFLSLKDRGGEKEPLLHFFSCT